jgi:DNA excision repair protein ERCC-2
LNTAVDSAVDSVIPTEAPAYSVAVRALCEFTAKEGDLDLRFTPSPTAQEGIAGHALVTARRSASYQRELSLDGHFGALHVRGRADGYDPQLHRLEEIKTFRGDLGAMPGNHRQLHWAQAKIYGHLQCQKLNCSSIELALVYFDIASQEETVLVTAFSAIELEQFFNLLCARFIDWAEQEMAHRSARDGALLAMSFPHASFRPGQRALAEALFMASKHGDCLLAQAPTGIGKTIGSLFPLLKASAPHRLDKIFFLAAKTSGRQLALGALSVIKKSTPLLPLRVLELVAKTTACEHPELACHGESCPLANGFYDRLAAARSAALQLQLQLDVPVLDRDSLRTVALAHQVCPYYLGMELVRWCDVIVGDYNYYFDRNALLHGLSVANGWRVSVLVDEAHNMVARARQMYSAQLVQANCTEVRKAVSGDMKKVLGRLHRQWRQLEKEQASPYAAYPAIPEKFLQALQACSAAIGDHFAENPRIVDPLLQRFYFDALHFIGLADSFADHSLFDITSVNNVANAANAASGSTLCIRNIIPGPFLQPRFAASHSTALFSATLSPSHFYCDMLGMPDTTAWVDVGSPFEAAQLTVRVARHISTRFLDRDRSLQPIADLMAQQHAAQAGNYLAFFSSFDYMEKVLAVFAGDYPDIATWQQERRMDDAARAEFLARFTLDGSGIGFAVLGGSFGEGIDLPGARLIGAFIATLGLPQINPVNEQIRRRMERLFGAGSGYDYTYLYPGLQKVVQAAGRVIRTESDRGVVYLIDDRFFRPQVQQLLPSWWQVDGSKK